MVLFLVRILSTSVSASASTNKIQISIYDSLLYLTPVKTQLLQYKLTRDLMLFYHSNKIKA